MMKIYVTLLKNQTVTRSYTFPKSAISDGRPKLLIWFQTVKAY